MAGCGYVCPLCEGKGFNEKGEDCEYCLVNKKEKDQKDKEDWIKSVHEGPCCSDTES